MKKKFVLVVFVIVAAVLAFVLVSRHYFNTTQKQMTSAKTVIPQAESLGERSSSNSSIIKDDTVIESLIPLTPDETLINIVSMDFNGDGYEDQVNVIKSADSPYLQLLVGLYNAQKYQYERVAQIATRVTQVKTFSYTGMDLVGDHRISLVYQGFDQGGNAVLQAYFIETSRGKVLLNQIADLQSNGSIYIDQVERDESYDQSLARGKSFAIWAYSSDDENPESPDQIQTCWEWDASQKKYVQTRQVRVKGSYVEAKELAGILDGTVDSFTGFLDGLWYKTGKTSEDSRYLFFDRYGKQIVFLIGDDEEVYNWQNNSLHYRGMYISATNFEIDTLQRNVNISLLSSNEIRVIIQDAVRMVISEENVWNGEYKKMNFSAAFYNKDSPSTLSDEYINNFEEKKAWKSSDGTEILFEKGNYSVSGDNISDSGEYIPLQISEKVFIQFRSGTSTPFFNGSYQVAYSSESSAANGNSEEPDKNRVILQPYVIKATDSYPSDSRPVILSHEGH
ncbi:MAG: pallilysin-related adhesin [Treponema sp.]|nr:pallilysin-related adhesin [Treponema sp.]